MEEILYKFFTSEKLTKHFQSIIDSAVERIVVKKENPNKWLTDDEAAKYLNIKKGTLNVKVSKKLIPHYKQGGERYFKLEELDLYIEAGKVKTVAEEKSKIDKNLKMGV